MPASPHHEISQLCFSLRLFCSQNDIRGFFLFFSFFPPSAGFLYLGSELLFSRGVCFFSLFNAALSERSFSSLSASTNRSQHWSGEASPILFFSLFCGVRIYETVLSLLPPTLSQHVDPVNLSSSGTICALINPRLFVYPPPETMTFSSLSFELAARTLQEAPLCSFQGINRRKF